MRYFPQIMVAAIAAAAAGEELVIHHPDFHARLGMPLRVEAGPAGKDLSLNAVLEDAGGSIRRTFTRSAPLDAEVTVPIAFRDLPRGDYTLTVRLSDGRSAVRQWTKPYDGPPRVGIDENNAIRVNGRLFFPVTPFNASSAAEVERWAPYVNTLVGVGFQPERYTIEGCRQLLDLARKHGKLAIVPGRGDYWLQGRNGTRLYPNPQDPGGKQWMDRAANHDRIAAYVEALRDHPALLFWDWCDEPDLDNGANAIPPEEVRRWTEICHQLDPHHPVYLNTTGKFGRPENNWGFQHVATYTYRGNSIPGPRRVLLADVKSIDFYPVAGQNDPNYDHSFETMVLALRRLREWNADLPALGAYVETCAISRTKGLPPPTPRELRLMTWANVIAGARMISWFHHFTETPPENFREIARFLDQVTRLTPAVCGPAYAGRIEQHLAGDGRVDWMANVAVEGDGALYLFVANLKRDPVNATFTLDFEPKRIEAFDEGRTLKMDGRAFTDAFEPLDVRIYRIER